MPAATIVWFRRDVRLADHPALVAACAAGGPVIPLVICDETVDNLGAAPAWRYQQAIGALAQDLAARGSRLTLRRGRALDVLREIVVETGAKTVVWMRSHDSASITRDTAVKSALVADGLTAQSFAGHLLHDPWRVKTGQGGPYRVFSPFWKAIRNRPVPPPVPTPDSVPGPDTWPRSDRLEQWGLGQRMNRGARILAQHSVCGEAAAQSVLADFVDHRLRGYVAGRDMMGAETGTSDLSSHLAVGEISVRTCWHAAMAQLQTGNPGAEAFLRQLAWREFAWHLLYHFPNLASENWRDGWDRFPWRTDPDHPNVRAWHQGRTGVPLVDAGLREMYVTGRMHNRARMLVASYLTKHLLTDWRIGLRWFDAHLTDWDPANNAMGWQWVAGSGPDAAPYFRIFNPDLQAKRFDADGQYRARWIAEGQTSPPDTALAFFEAIPRTWNMRPTDPYPAPIVAHDVGRATALAAYESRRD